MNYKNIVLLAAILLTMSVPVLAQDTRHLTLTESIELGLKNNKNLKIAAARIEESVAAVTEAKDKRLPDFKVSGSYLRLSSANVSLRTKSEPADPSASSPKVSQALYGMANLSLPVYAGGRIKYGIESAKLLEEASRLDADNDREAVIFNIINAYTNFHKASQSIAVIKENLQASFARDTTFSRLEANGIIARNDLLKAKLQSSNIELTLLDAENDLKLANINMALLLGLHEDQVITLDTSFINGQPVINTFEKYEELAFQNRKDIRANAVRSKAAALESRSAKAASYPTIALTGGYIAADIPNLLTITNAVNIGVGIQYNLAALWKSNTALKQAKAREQIVIATGGLIANDIRLNINKDYQDYLLSLKKTEVYERSYEQAQENYRITNNKYNNSLVTISELLDADVALLQAKLNRQIAKSDVYLATKKLELTSGVLIK